MIADAMSTSPERKISHQLQPPGSRSPFSLAVRAGGFVFVSGQASVDGKGQIVSDTFEGEMRRSMDHVIRILAAERLTLADVVQARSYIARQEDIADYNRIYREYFPEPYPARTTIINCLGSLLKFEIDVTAYAG
jgi:2-iminobutanoate/2-iminopropanoate deaminase